MKLETFFSVVDVRRQIFPTRSVRWIKDTFRTGEFGAVLRDQRGWMVSESAVAGYQSRHRVTAGEFAGPDRRGNLLQFQK